MLGVPGMRSRDSKIFHFHAVFGNKNRLVEAFMTTQILKLMQITRVFLIAYVWGGRRIRFLNPSLILTYVGATDSFGGSAGEPGGTHVPRIHDNSVSRVPVLVGFPYSSPCKTSTDNSVSRVPVLISL